MFIVSAFILLLCIVIPNLAPSLNFSRFYAITLLILSPCFVIGGEMVVDITGALWKKITKKHFLGNIKKVTKILLFIVIVGYFVSQLGFVNIVVGLLPCLFH